MTWVAVDNKEMHAVPGLAIRAFLREVFASLGIDHAGVDGAVSLSEQARLRQRLVGELRAFYRELDADPSQDRVQRLFSRFYGESATMMQSLALREALSGYDASKASVSLLSQRPAVEVGYDQLYCTPGSTERRVDAILSRLPNEDARVLFVGDDDLGSPILAQRWGGEVHVIDLDLRLLSFIQERAPQVQCHTIDLIQGGVPRWMREHFDIVVLDPPWDLGGAWCFLSRALYCLKQLSTARIMLAFCPIQMEVIGSQMRRFWERLGRFGLTCQSLTSALHLYDLSPMATDSYQKAFGLYLPSRTTPFFEQIKKVPYTYSHLYELRRIHGFSLSRLRQWWFHWWLTHQHAHSEHVEQGVGADGA